MQVIGGKLAALALPEEVSEQCPGDLRMSMQRATSLGDRVAESPSVDHRRSGELKRSNLSVPEFCETKL